MTEPTPSDTETEQIIKALPEDVRGKVLDWLSTALFQQEAQAQKRTIKLLAKVDRLKTQNAAMLEALKAVEAVTRIGDDLDFAEAFGAAMHKVRPAIAAAEGTDND